MGKRKQLIVLSSDDEEKDETLSFSRSNPKRSYEKPKSRPLLPKKARISNSRTNFDESLWFPDDFDQVFNASKVSADSRCKTNELWADKYKPHSLEELAVHKKKVEEVKVWFEDQLRPSKGKTGSQVIIINGQAGVGKSATIHAVASHLGAKVYEWRTPTPTIWQEHLHSLSTGVRYTSKLDEFENFVEKVRKYGLIPSSCSGTSKASNILLIDDLPVANGRNSFGRLQSCLHLLVQSVQMPTVLLLTDYGKARSADSTTQCLEELQSSLENAGACKVVFNPITENSIKKVISKICRLEHYDATAEQINFIAKASGGDIRHAITSLQFFCLNPSSMRFSSSSFTSHLDDKKDALHSLHDTFSMNFGRDESLSLFHALGKFLHNKRETDNAPIAEKETYPIQERFTRLPLKMDAPEKVLCQAHGQARPITEFLHENVLEFLNEDAIYDAWTIASYLGDADLLLSTSYGKFARNSDAESVLQSTAASVAVRGVLYGNSQPLRSRWHAIRRPRLWQVEQSYLRNKCALVRQGSVAYNGRSLSDVSTIATEYTPVSKLFEDYRGPEDSQITIVDNEFDNINMDRMILENQESDISEDEIEDW